MFTRSNMPIGKYDLQSLLGLVRLFLLVFLTIAIGTVGSTVLDGIDPREIAQSYRESIWLFRFMPEWQLVIFAAVFNLSTFRYMIAPIGAFLFIMISGAYFVKDTYSLPSFKLALSYVLSSMFAVGYPVVVVEKGEKQLRKDEVNLIDKIGGPGFVVIEPGNAAMFRELRGPSGASVSQTYFLNPFETIAQTVNLDEHQGYREKMSAMTRDGIKVVISDIHFRYRILQEKKRTLTNVFPFSESAIRDMTFNLSVTSDGLESWSNAVAGAVTGGIGQYVSSHNIDFMTAPRTGQAVARLELRNSLFMPHIQGRLRGLGAELLWVDVGHVEIEDKTVDETRTNLWSADWAGDAREVRAYGDAVRQAYQELGRAEAQADLIMSIASALNEANLTNPTPENLRRILLTRSAQILRAMSKNGEQPQKGDHANPGEGQ